MQEAKAIDLGFCGRKFTWFNRQEGTDCIRRHLYCVVACHSWLCLFPQAVVHHLGLERFDHLPILIKMHEKDEIHGRSFRFLHTRVVDNSSFRVVKELWDKGLNG